MTDNSTAESGTNGEPPGWYADPWGRADQRWWNGHEWSDRTRAVPDEKPPAEGWYDDPDDSTLERWWDGQDWSDETRPASESERAVIEWQARRGPDPKPGPVFADMDDPYRWSQPATDSRSGEVNLLKVLVGVIGVSLVVLVLVGVAGGLRSPTPTSTPEPSIAGSEYEAWVACQDFTERRLRAPSTADFPGRSEAAITTRGDEWVVEAYVDAENGFGAMIRNEWRCTASKSGDTWTGSSTILE